MYMGPKSMLAPFSDDLETIDTDGDGTIDKWIDVYVKHDDSNGRFIICLLYTSPSPRDGLLSRMPSSA